MKKYMIKLNNKDYEVEIEEVVTGATVESATTIIENSTPSKTDNSAQSLGGTTIEAPMAGSIFTIEVKIGDKIKKDQTLLILEAMKMENEISSPVDGTVLSIGVSKGDMVNAGIELIRIG